MRTSTALTWCALMTKDETKVWCKSQCTLDQSWGPSISTYLACVGQLFHSVPLVHFNSFAASIPRSVSGTCLCESNIKFFRVSIFYQVIGCPAKSCYKNLEFSTSITFYPKLCRIFPVFFISFFEQALCCTKGSHISCNLVGTFFGAFFHQCYLHLAIFTKLKLVALTAYRQIELRLS